MGDLSLIKKAEALELDRAKFYSKNASKVLNPSGKKILIKLSNAEKRHLQILRKNSEFIKKQNKIEIPNVNVNEFDFLKKDLEKEIKANQTDINILEKAIKLEKIDAPFYINLSKKAKAKELKKLFNLIQKEEKNHIKNLIKTLKTIKNQGYNESISKNPRMNFLEFFTKR